MKTNAIVRIVIYTVVILLLVSILVVALFADAFMENVAAGSDDLTEHMTAVSADGIKNLEIDWAAGSVTIQTSDTDTITIAESGNYNEKYNLVKDVSGSTLSIDYTKSSYVFGVGSLPSKDLIITVPHGLYWESLEIDGAALEIDINGLTIDSIELDGAALEFSFDGAFDQLDCDGASCELSLITSAKPQSISIDGAACQLDLTLPDDCGFLVQTDGLGCKFESDVDYTSGSGDYLYGDRYCQVNVEGLSCQVYIQHVYQEHLPTIPYNGSNG